MPMKWLTLAVALALPTCASSPDVETKEPTTKLPAMEFLLSPYVDTSADQILACVYAPSQSKMICMTLEEFSARFGKAESRPSALPDPKNRSIQL